MENIEEKLLEHKYWVWVKEREKVGYTAFIQSTIKFKRLVEPLFAENAIVNRDAKTIAFNIVTPEQILKALNNNYKKEIKYGRKRKDGSRKQS